jgi:hypothetical protein
VNALSVGFRAFDPHELLVHFIAQREGVYRQLEIEVELVDLRPGERPHDATVACGAALYSALAGTPTTILLIASRGPLFWLYGPEGAVVGGTQRVATYPAGAPPGRFLKLAIGDEATFLPARDDRARIAMVRSGEAQLGLLSSATPPSRVDDLEPLLCLADRLRIPTTGIAANPRDELLLEPLVEAHRRALRLIAANPQLAAAACDEAFGFDGQEAAWAAALAQRYFTADGRVGKDQVDAALASVGGTRSPYASSAVCGL